MGSEICCFTIKFTKDLGKAKKSKQYSLENKQKFLESNLNYNINSVEYINCKNQFEEIYVDIAGRIKVRRKCQWYEECEKSVVYNRATWSTVVKSQGKKILSFPYTYF